MAASWQKTVEKRLEKVEEPDPLLLSLILSTQFLSVASKNFHSDLKPEHFGSDLHAQWILYSPSTLPILVDFYHQDGENIPAQTSYYNSDMALTLRIFEEKKKNEEMEVIKDGIIERIFGEKGKEDDSYYISLLNDYFSVCVFSKKDKDFDFVLLLKNEVRIYSDNREEGWKDEGYPEYGFGVTMCGSGWESVHYE